MLLLVRARLQVSIYRLHALLFTQDDVTDRLIDQMLVYFTF